MMAQTIRRKATGVRRQTRAHDTKRQVRQARQKTNSLIDWLMRRLPFTEDQLHAFFLLLILLFAAVLAWFLASMAGLTLLLGEKVDQMAIRGGFEADRVDVRGTRHLNQLMVYDQVLGAKDRAMTDIDLEALRASVMQLNWVKDARVSRQLPGTIVVDIVERTPHAVLRKPGMLELIDETGHDLEPISPAKAKGKLLISGPGAQGEVEALDALLDAAPAIRPQVAEAEWVGNRRWNLTFKSGQMLALPEGIDDSAKALINFAQLDGVNRLIGGKVVAFDMRTPGRIYMRCPECAAENNPPVVEGGPT
ncbi:MAG TPA: cell division protein FtsQ/DivIB [Croceibacterium sp.]|jgi:cell division protein FtsQ|nr:cell division protein FtsQ/DivIB [Croceibacterium sp.]